MLAGYMLSLCVRVSVYLASIVSKRLNVGSQNNAHSSPETLHVALLRKISLRNSDAITLNESVKCR